MSKLPLTFACGLYDRMLALHTGEVQVEGVDLPYHTTFASVFERADKQGHREPFVLPERWRQGKD